MHLSKKRSGRRARVPRRLHGEEGQVVAWFAGMAIMTLAIIALGIDLGFLFHARRIAQNAADAGALAGAQELPGCGDQNPDPLELSNDYANLNLAGKAYTIGDSVEPAQYGSYAVSTETSYQTVYQRLTRQQSYIFAKFLGLVSAQAPAEAEAVCGPIKEGSICPFYIEGDPNAPVVRGEDPDGDGPQQGPVLSAYGLDIGHVYGMKVNTQNDDPSHYGSLRSPTGSGVNAWRSFLRNGCNGAEDEELQTCEGCEVPTEPGNYGNPALQAFEGGGAGGADSPGLYKPEKTMSSLFPQDHLSCNLHLTLDPTDRAVVTAVRKYDSAGHPTGDPLTPEETVEQIDVMTDPSKMVGAAAPPCAAVRKDGTEVPELHYTAVQGRFMQIALTDGACQNQCELAVLGILRMYIVCWILQQTEGGQSVDQVRPADSCAAPSGGSWQPSDVTIYGVFADYSAPNLLPGSGLGVNPLAPKHVVLVR